MILFVYIEALLAANLHNRDVISGNAITAYDPSASNLYSFRRKNAITEVLTAANIL